MCESIGVSSDRTVEYQPVVAKAITVIMSSVDVWMRCYSDSVRHIDTKRDGKVCVGDRDAFFIVNHTVLEHLDADHRDPSVVSIRAPRVKRVGEFSIGENVALMWVGEAVLDCVHFLPMSVFRSSVVAVCISHSAGDLGSIYLSPFSFYECKNIRLVIAFADTVTISGNAFWKCTSPRILVVVHPYSKIRIVGELPTRVEVTKAYEGGLPCNTSTVDPTSHYLMDIECPCEALEEFDRTKMPWRLVHIQSCRVESKGSRKASSYTDLSDDTLPDVTKLFG